MKKSVLCIAISAGLTGCFGHDKSDHTPPAPEKEQGQQQAENPAPYLPDSKAVDQLTIVDASGKPLANAEVTVTAMSSSAISIAAVAAGDTFFTDSQGNISLNGMEPGTYTLRITIAGVSVSTRLVIEAGNAAPATTVAAPVSVKLVDGVIQATSQEGNGFFASLAGVIYDLDGPVMDAQVELDGGAVTNGVITGTLTNASGEFLLLINMDTEKAAALESVTLRVIRAGYETLSIHLDLSTIQGLAGMNYGLTASSDTSLPIYREDFESQSETCGSWVAADTDPGASLVQPMASGDSPLNLWHQHTAGLTILNQAVVENLVTLAPDDTSAGYIPEPSGSGACWYGQATAGNLGQGNFMGTPLPLSATGSTGEGEAEAETTQGDEQSELEGGTSAEANRGAIVSPWIDLSAESAPLALNFKTWWEIEAVNPNENGFDIMEVDYSLDGNEWVTVARLNPLTDPADDTNRAPLPFTNAGYNRAPYWQQVQPIDISDVAGKTAKFRFSFRTQDELFNGFRGWLIDDVTITNESGSFPPPGSGSADDELPSADLLSDINAAPAIGAVVPASLEVSFSIDAVYNGDNAALVKLIRTYPEDGFQQVIDEHTVTSGGNISLGSIIQTSAEGTDFDLSVHVYDQVTDVLLQVLPLNYSTAEDASAEPGIEI